MWACHETIRYQNGSWAFVDWNCPAFFGNGQILIENALHSFMNLSSAPCQMIVIQLSDACQMWGIWKAADNCLTIIWQGAPNKWQLWWESVYNYYFLWLYFPRRTRQLLTTDQHTSDLGRDGIRRLFLVIISGTSNIASSLSFSSLSGLLEKSEVVYIVPHTLDFNSRIFIYFMYLTKHENKISTGPQDKGYVSL